MWGLARGPRPGFRKTIAVLLSLGRFRRTYGARFLKTRAKALGQIQLKYRKNRPGRAVLFFYLALLGIAMLGRVFLGVPY